ncbi:MAG: hypothetical protein ACTTJ6_05160, partial [Treponema sp.]
MSGNLLDCNLIRGCNMSEAYASAMSGNLFEGGRIHDRNMSTLSEWRCKEILLVRNLIRGCNMSEAYASAMRGNLLDCNLIRGCNMSEAYASAMRG